MADGDEVVNRLERSVDAQLRAARERGEFDNLPGYGKPLPNVDGEPDDLWWIRQWLRRENLSFTPPALAIRKSVEDMLAGLHKLRTERAVRGVVQELNTGIRTLNRTPQFDGPPTSLSPLDEEEIVARWRSVRGVVDEPTTIAPSAEVAHDAEEPTGGGVVPTTLGQWVALLVAAVILAGGVGYLLGNRRSVPSATSADVGFMRDMIDHHDQAIQLSLLETRNGTNPTVQHFAHEILRQQSVEIGMMTRQLEDWGYDRRAEVGPAMRWMGHDDARSDAMPGMASPDEMEALGVARGAEADALFIRLMQDHHVGGAEMAEYAATHAASSFVKDIARRMASVQRQEISEMEAARTRAGLEANPPAWTPAFEEAASGHNHTP